MILFVSLLVELEHRLENSLTNFFSALTIDAVRHGHTSDWPVVQLISVDLSIVVLKHFCNLPCNAEGTRFVTQPRCKSILVVR